MHNKRTTVDFINLTNGLKCLHHVQHPHYVRMQSTWCEQKRWTDILWTVSDDLLYHLAVGDHCRVHDVSERGRETPACWQGLRFIQYACHSAWGVDASESINQNFEKVLPREMRVWKRLTYYTRFNGGQPTSISICDGRSSRIACTPTQIPRSWSIK